MMMTMKIIMMMTLLTVSLFVMEVTGFETSPHGVTSNVSINLNQDSLQLDEEMEDTIWYEGETVQLSCEITGSPLPTYTWYKNNSPIQSGTPRFFYEPILWGSRLTIKGVQVNDEGLYRCVGKNSFSEAATEGTVKVLTGVNPNKSKMKMAADLDLNSGTIDPDVDIKPIYSEFPAIQPYDGEPIKKHRNDDVDTKNPENQNGFCQPYVGSSCSKYLNNQSIFVLDINYQSMHEEWIKGHLSSLVKLDEISFPCQRFLAPVLCLITFPTCHGADIDNIRKSKVRSSRTKKLCKEDCEIVISLHCKDEFSDYNLLKYSSIPVNIIEKVKYENIHRLLSIVNCKDLKSNHRSGHCNSAAIPSISPYDDSKCYIGDGHTYKGVIHKTRSRDTCIRWSDIGLLNGINLINTNLMDHNLCRNPDRSMPGPWCFVEAEVGHTKELCAMDLCEHETTDTYHKGFLVGVPCVILIVVIVTLVVCTRMRKEAGKNRKLADNKNEPQPQQQHNNPQLKNLLDRQSFQSSSTPPYIGPTNISLNYEIFQQPYGKVYRGEILSFSSPIGGPVVPAIFRTLDQNSTAKLQLEFWKEIDRVCDFHHPNITAVLGLNKTSQPNFVAYEASSYGDLNNYLKSNSEIVKCQPGEMFSMSRASVLPNTVLVSISVQVVSALEFLHSKNFIHTELNSYNVLVCENGVVKISLVLPGDGSNYFMTTQGRPIPLRWSPPEVLTSLSFSDKSDVWSFGVLLWEIYSCASIPYGSLSDIEVLESIKTFRILSCPHQCPAEMYALIVQCWHKVPSSRLTSRELHDQLRQLWAELNRVPSMNPSLGSNHSQGNTNHNTSYDNHQPLLHQQQQSSTQQLTPNRHISSHSSSASQKSSPASSACNFKLPVVLASGKDFGSVGKKCYYKNEICMEQIV